VGIYTLSKRDASKIIEKMVKKWPVTPELNKSIQVRVLEIDKQARLLILTNFEAIELDNLLMPSLKSNEILEKFPYVEVDQGAVPYICNGADVMRPGIIKWGTFKKDDIVGVREINYKKFIAVGVALIDQSDMEGMKKGAAIKNLHYVGDKFWQAYKQVQS